MLEKTDVMNIKCLRVYIFIIEEGTLAKAANRIHLSQPAASRLLKILEDDLGVLLFQRLKKRLIPTKEGEAFYAEAIRVLASFDGIPSFINSIQNDKPTPLRIVCLPRLSEGLILPAIIKLSKIQPNVRVKLEIHARRDLERGIAHQLYDVGVSSLPIPAKNIELEPLCSARLYIVLGKNHPLSKKSKLTIQDVAGLPYIALDKTTLIQQVVEERLARSGVNLDPVYEVSTVIAALQLVRSNLGFTIIDPLSGRVPQQGEFCFLPWQPKTLIEFGIFKMQSDQPHEALDDFVGCLHDSCKEALAGFIKHQ